MNWASFTKKKKKKKSKKTPGDSFQIEQSILINPKLSKTFVTSFHRKIKPVIYIFFISPYSTEH